MESQSEPRRSKKEKKSEVKTEEVSGLKKRIGGIYGSLFRGRWGREGETQDRLKRSKTAREHPKTASRPCPETVVVIENGMEDHSKLENPSLLGHG